MVIPTTFVRAHKTRVHNCDQRVAKFKLNKRYYVDDEIFMNKEGSIGGDIFNLELSDNGPNFCSIQKNVLNRKLDSALRPLVNFEKFKVNPIRIGNLPFL